MIQLKFFLLIIGLYWGSLASAQRPTLITLESIVVSINHDTVATIKKTEIPIPYFQRKTEVVLFENDSIKISKFIKYRERKSGMKSMKTRPQFYFKGKKLRGTSRWQSDLPFMAKLTGISFRWEYQKGNTRFTRGILKGVRDARLPKNRGAIRLYCIETMIH